VRVPVVYQSAATVESTLAVGVATLAPAAAASMAAVQVAALPTREPAVRRPMEQLGPWN